MGEGAIRRTAKPHSEIRCRRFASRRFCPGGPMSAQTDEHPLPAAPDVTQAFAAWMRHLGTERQFAANTLEAYERDIRQLIQFLAAREGKPVTLAMLNCLDQQELRAFMAARRTEGACSRSLSRALSAMR